MTYIDDFIDESKFKVQTVVDKLLALGSADQIALELEAHNIKSVPGCIDLCAIAEYIQDETDVYVEVSANSIQFNTHVYNHDSDDAVTYRTTAYNLVSPETDPILDFINEFDKFQYPDLVDYSRNVEWAS